MIKPGFIDQHVPGVSTLYRSANHSWFRINLTLKQLYVGAPHKKIKTLLEKDWSKRIINPPPSFLPARAVPSLDIRVGRFWPWLCCRHVQLTLTSDWRGDDWGECWGTRLADIVLGQTAPELEWMLGRKHLERAMRRGRDGQWVRQQIQKTKTIC